MTKGKIYKITFDEGIYYGSTTQKYLSSRLAQHNSKKSSNHGITKKFNNGKIELIEEIEFEDKKELLLRERYFIENFECLNHYLPTRSKEEYIANPENKKKAIIRAQEWNAKHKEERKQYLKEYHILHGTEKRKETAPHPCKEGKTIRKDCLSRHKKTCSKCNGTI